MDGRQVNERLRALSREAWAWAEQQEYTDPTKEFSDILEQKFAELIVRECAAYVKNSNCFTYASQSDLCAERLKERFGVE